MRWWLGALLAMGCGRLDFDARGTRDATDAADAPEARDVLDAPAPGDASTPIAAFVSADVHSGSAVPGLSYAFTTSAAADYLLVAVQVGGNSGTDTSVPAIDQVLYGTTALTRAEHLLGLPTNANVPLTELWELVAPPVGSASISVTLASTAPTLHVGTMAFGGIDQAQPIRAAATATGVGSASSVTVASAAGDLVVDLVGQGFDIVAPGSGQAMLYVHDVSSNNASDNSAASDATATSTATTMTWSFAQSDDFQTIAVSLRP